MANNVFREKHIAKHICDNCMDCNCDQSKKRKLECIRYRKEQLKKDMENKNELQGRIKMNYNGYNIKKYKARVVTSYVQRDNGKLLPEIKTVEGFVSIANIIVPYGKATPQYTYVFISDEPEFSRVVMSGFGQTVLVPMAYENFEIIGEVEDEETT